MRKVLIAGALLTTCFAFGTEALAFDPEEQVLTSDLIVTGRVLSVRTANDWNDVEVDVDQVWKGEPHAMQIVVRAPGGALDDPGLSLEGSARFTTGENVLLFLTRVGDTWRPWRTVFGKYTIRGEGLDARLIGTPPLLAELPDAEWLVLDDVRNEVQTVATRDAVTPAMDLAALRAK